jgi:hypothetical protein
MEEARLGGQYRTAGGLYVCGKVEGIEPFCLDTPPLRCIAVLTDAADIERVYRRSHLPRPEKIGLGWVGFPYTPATFLDEAERYGVCKRISRVPRLLAPGDTIALAHTNAIVPGEHCAQCAELPAALSVASALLAPWRHSLKANGFRYHVPGYRTNSYRVMGIFCVFTITRYELVLPESFELTAAQIKACAQRAVAVVRIADNDARRVMPGWRLPHFLRQTVGEALCGGGETGGVAEDASSAVPSSVGDADGILDAALNAVAS